MQRINHRVASCRVGGVARGQKYEDVSVGSISFQIAFQEIPVNLHMLNGDGFGSGNNVGNVVFNLSLRNRRVSQQVKQ